MDYSAVARMELFGGQSQAVRSCTLYFDGACGLCSGLVARTIQRGRKAAHIKFAPLQGAHGAQLRRRYPRLVDGESIVLVTEDLESHRELIYTRSSAVIALATETGILDAPLAAIFLLAPRFMRDAAYDWVAHRRRVLSRSRACPLPPTSERNRFLD